MKYIYLVYEYKPKHKRNGWSYEGMYNYIPKAFENLKKARKHLIEYKHAAYIKKVKLR